MEFEYGNEVDVRDYDEEPWEPAVYKIKDEGNEYQHIARTEDSDVAAGYIQCRHRQPDLKVDDPVWVNDCRLGWIPRHFKAWSSDGRIICYPTGRTSHTSINDGIIYDGWSLTKLDETE